MNELLPTAPMEIVYLTGAPGTGKSSLAQSLAERFSNVKIFSYGERMVNRLQSTTRLIKDQVELRGGPDPVVMPADILAVDREMVAWVQSTRVGRLLLIDTHQVTLEQACLRFVPFQPSTLDELPLTRIWFLSAAAETVVQRTTKQQMGRIIPSINTAALHASAQLAVAVHYSVVKGVELRMFDSDCSMDRLAEKAISTLGL